MPSYLDLTEKGVRNKDAVTAQWFSVTGKLQPLVWDVLRELEPCHICHIKWAYLKENFLPYNEKAGYILCVGITDQYSIRNDVTQALVESIIKKKSHPIHSFYEIEFYYSEEPDKALFCVFSPGRNTPLKSPYFIAPPSLCKSKQKD